MDYVNYDVLYLFHFIYIVLTVSSSIAVYPGETATFNCNASSDDTFSTTYEWERMELNGDKNLVLSDDDIDGSGSTFDYSYILAVNNVNFSDNGVGFYCRAVNFSDSEVAYLNGKLSLSTIVLNSRDWHRIYGFPRLKTTSQ